MGPADCDVTRSEIVDNSLYVVVNRGWALFVRFRSFYVPMTRNASFIFLIPDSAV